MDEFQTVSNFHAIHDIVYDKFLIDYDHKRGYPKRMNLKLIRKPMNNRLMIGTQGGPL